MYPNSTSMPRGQKSSGYTHDGNSLERLANSSVAHQARYPLMWGRPYTEAAGGSRGSGIGLGGQTRCRPSDEVKSLMNLEGRFRGQYKHLLHLGAFLHYKIRWSDCLVFVDNEFIIVQRSTGDPFHENLLHPPKNKHTAHGIVSRWWCSQRWGTSSQFLAVSNDDLVQQQRLQIGMDAHIF